MGKKQKVVLFFLAAAIMVLSGYLPEFFLSKVPTAKAIVPSQTTYTPYISCSGTLQAENVKEIYAMHPVMIDQVYIHAGEWVEKGEIIASVNLETTQVLMCNAAAAPKIEGEVLEEYRMLAKEYGMETKLEEYLMQNTFIEEAQPYFAVSENIIAEHSGKILSLNIASGRLVNTAEQLYTIASSPNCSVVLHVDQEDIALIAPKNPVLLSGPGFESKQYRAMVTEIAPIVTHEKTLLEDNSYVEVRARLLDSAGILRPGLNVQAKIAVGESTVATLLPYQAIAQDNNNREYIYCLQDGKPVQRYIDVVKEDSSFVYAGCDLSWQPILLEAENIITNKQYRFEYLEDVND